MPLGWRPEDVAEKYPVNKISDVYNFEKYNPFSIQGHVGLELCTTDCFAAFY